MSNRSGDKEALLRSLAENGYNIGFGGKRHLKSYDILSSVPRLFSFLIICVGIIQMTKLYESNFENINEIISVILMIAGIIALLADLSSENKEEYNKKGVLLIGLFNELRDLYNQVEKATDDNLIKDVQKRMREIVKEASENSINKQIWFSSWWAHIGFFYETQIDWMDNELKFKFWKDKVPATFKLMISISLFIFIIFLAIRFFK